MNEVIATAPTRIAYQSPDLELFIDARRWKRYWSKKLTPYIGGQVIEVGAGLGGSTEYMVNPRCSAWLCLEPDPSLVAQIPPRIAGGELPPYCSAQCGVLRDLAAEVSADTIVYIDVLEHIEDDEDEIRRATRHLRRGGHLIVLCPAFNLLYSELDKAVGHFRRYKRADITRLTPPELVVRKLFFLDSVGFFASLANRLLVKSSLPTAAQIALWDRLMVPLSRYAADWVFGSVFGKTIVAVWQKA
jgi:hypothetical protein